MKNSAEPRRPRRKRKAFTLVETLVAIGIAAVALLTIFEVFPMGFAASTRSQARAVATSIASDILATFRRELGKPVPQYAFAYGFSSSMSPGFSNSYTLFSSGYSAPTPNFVAGNDQYYWRVVVHEVLDSGGVRTNPPTMPLYQSFIGSPLSAGGNVANLVGCRRVTVYVRGPFVSAAQATYFEPSSGKVTWPAGGSKVAAVEVAMATYVTNYGLGNANVKASGSQDYLAQTGMATFAGGVPPGANKINIDTADNFSAFNAGALSPNEFLDTGPAFPYSSSTPTRGGNYLGLDNVWIGPAYPPAPPYDPVANINYDPRSGESNKIVRVSAGGGVFTLWFAYPIRGYPTGDPANPYTAYFLNQSPTYPPAGYPVSTVRSLVLIRR